MKMWGFFSLFFLLFTAQSAFSQSGRSLELPQHLGTALLDLQVSAAYHDAIAEVERADIQPKPQVERLGEDSLDMSELEGASRGFLEGVGETGWNESSIMTHLRPLLERSLLRR
jgi:hypothetical protein